jgi:competence protein ComEC
VAAWLGSAGILLYHFYNITPLASVWTLIAAAPVTAILTVGFVKILVAFFLPTLSLLLGHMIHFLAELLIWMVRLMAQIDPSYILIGRTPWVLIVLFYALVLFAAFVPLRRPLVKKALCAAMLLMLLVPLGVMKWQRTHRDHLSITCLDVGHGQAILARLPGTMNVLFDAGSLFAIDIGTRIVVPFLDHEGISRLDAAIVSHRDVDHINGVPEVVDRRSVDRVYFDEISFAQSQDVETVQALMSHLADRRVPAERMPETIEAGPATMRVLWPQAQSIARAQLSDNDKSLVCLIEYAGRKVLLCSDIESLAQREIMALYPTLRADVVVVPHHGSVRTLDGRFLDQLAPRVLLCSCGVQDFEQGRVMKAPMCGKLLVTARNGAVNVCIDRDGVIQTTVTVGNSIKETTP